jgi:hypothetical protein
LGFRGLILAALLVVSWDFSDLRYEGEHTTEVTNEYEHENGDGDGDGNGSIGGSDDEDVEVGEDDREELE